MLFSCSADAQGVVSLTSYASAWCQGAATSEGTGWDTCTNGDSYTTRSDGTNGLDLTLSNYYMASYNCNSNHLVTTTCVAGENKAGFLDPSAKPAPKKVKKTETTQSLRA